MRIRLKFQINHFIFLALKINQKPNAVVTPVSQIITLPTRKAIIDGSSSTDDGDVSKLTYKWEIRKTPLDYPSENQELSTDSTLTLEGLVAGNYTIRLTVSDSDGMKIE